VEREGAPVAFDHGEDGTIRFATEIGGRYVVSAR